jgi:hypothetical protein
MDTLWQRFGRGGRDPSLQATGVLLVEDSCYDLHRARALKRGAQRKRKAGAQPTEASRPSKRVQTSITTQTTGPSFTTASAAEGEEEGENEEEEAEQDEEADKDSTPADILQYMDMSIIRRTDVQRRYAYHHTSTLRSAKNGKQPNSLLLGTALDDLVNAPTREIKCRRRVPTLFYDNDKHCEYFSLCGLSS